VLLGALVLLDTGLSSFPDLPLSSTFGFTQTPLLGAINVAVGLLLLLGASGWERGITTFATALSTWTRHRAAVRGGLPVIARTSPRICR
jgi:hypothetical protein